jgi:hypothetical protein
MVMVVRSSIDELLIKSYRNKTAVQPKHKPYKAICTGLDPFLYNLRAEIGFLCARTDRAVYVRA